MPRTIRPGEPKVRVAFDLSTRSRSQLDSLVVRTQSDSMTEVVRRALAILEVVISTQEQGGRIIQERPDGSRVELMSF